MKIIVVGASGSGTTTLGKSLASTLNYIHLDADDYYWEKTNPPFREKIPLGKRNASLATEFKQTENVVLSGSLVSWGDPWKTAFDLAIFLFLPNEIRMKRLRAREVERYGSLLLTDPFYRKNSQAFLDWAQRYDDPAFEGRSLQAHLNWLNSLDCPVLRIEGEIELKDQIKTVLDKIRILARD
jgi:adenylate kinase family enzyme